MHLHLMKPQTPLGECRESKISLAEAEPKASAKRENEAAWGRITIETSFSWISDVLRGRFTFRCVTRRLKTLYRFPQKRQKATKGKPETPKNAENAA